jgi:hypothetical protein
VSIDNIERSTEGAIRIRWEDFRDSLNPWRASNDTTLYFLDAVAERPVLWLNSRHSKLKALLLSRSEQGPDAGMRHIVGAWLAETVWTQLFYVALGGAGAEGRENPQSLPEGWRGDVLRQYLSKMFPDEEDPQQALASALRMRANQDEIGALVGLVTTVTQQATRSHNLFAEAVRSLEQGEPVAEATR